MHQNYQICQKKEILIDALSNHENYKRDAYRLFDGEFWETDKTGKELNENDYAKRVKLETIEINEYGIADYASFHG